MICSVSHRQIRSLTCPDSHGWSRCFSSAKSKRQRWRQSGAVVSEALCPSRGASRDHTSRECQRRGPAELGEQLLVSISLDDVSDAAVRKRAVVQWFSWGHWLRVPRKVLTRCRTAGRCVLMPKLSSVLKSVPNAQRHGCATEDTDLAIEPTQRSHTVFKQHLISVFSPRTTSRGQMGVGNWATLRAPCADVSASYNSPLLALAGLVRPLMMQGSTRYAGSGRPLSRSPGHSGLSLQLR